MGRWHYMHDLPLFLRCYGCGLQIRVSEPEHYRVHQGISQSGWIRTKDDKILCPSCVENGIPSDAVTIEKIGELVKKQWNLAYVKPISQNGNDFYFMASGFGLLRQLSITVTHDREQNAYRVTVYDGVSRDLGNLNTA